MQGSSSNNEMIIVALDAMGGDYGPSVTVPAAVVAAERARVGVALVGDAPLLELELAKYDSPARQLIKVVPAEGVVEENESPMTAFKTKPRASIFTCAGVVKAGKAHGFVSMGSTGATMGAATVTLGAMPGVDRGALGGNIIGYSPNTIIIDLGTNVDARPGLLVNFAALGLVTAKVMLKIDDPTVALLSVGTEDSKGNVQVKQVGALLRRSHLNFVGNVEASDLVNCRANVVVCDGFVGNVVLKLTESLGKRIADDVHATGADIPAVAELSREVMRKTNTLSIYGGGPIVGLNGIAIVGHGAADVEAVSAAILTAKMVIESDFVGQQARALTQIADLAQ